MTDYERFGDYSTQTESTSNFGFGLMFLFIGLGIGAITALMFAPKSGKQIRRQIRRRYEDARDAIDGLAIKPETILTKAKAGRAKRRIAYRR